MKKNIIYLFCVAIFFASCSSAYRSSQTPDDVYYSPAKKIIPAGNEDQYNSYTSSSDDEYLRMKAADHYRWSNLDDFDYWNDSRYYYNNYYSPYNNYYSYSSWNVGYSPYASFWYNPWSSWYNPVYTVVYYKNPAVYYGSNSYNRYHLSTYNNRNYNNFNMPLQSGNRSDAYNNSNLSNRRNTNYNINQNQNRNNSNPVRLFNNNNSNTNINSGSRSNVNSGGGSMSRPPRGGH